LEAVAQTQKGALDRYVVKESQFTSENQTPNANIDEGHGEDASNMAEVEVQTTQINHEVSGDNGVAHADLDGSPSIENNNDINNSLDIFDPRYWDSLDSKQVDILVQKGPKRDLSIHKGPKDRFS
ncbi:hypothetical protein BAE44_0008937, partial [Dichanthelium oligosanthes]